ncbi:MAG: MFS transporter [Gemmatimonadetes bacterium]|nr:MFS transporter [Gemmatimonadota bacterium]
MSATPAAPAAAEPGYPPPRLAWTMVAILTIANASAFVDRFVLALLVTPIRADLHVSETQMGLLLGLPFALFYAVAGVPIGWLADRKSRRGIIAASIAVWSVTTMSCAAARSFGALFLARMGVAIGEAGLWPAAYSMIADAFPPRRLATAMSTFSLGIFLGAGTANVVGGALVAAIGAATAWSVPLLGELKPWQAMFLAVGAPGLVIAMVTGLLPEPRRRSAVIRSEAKEPLAPAKQVLRSAQDDKEELLAFLRRHRFMLATFTLGVASFATVNNGIASWLPTFFQRTHGWSTAQAGLVAGTFTITIGVAGALFGGWWADRMRGRGRADADLVVFLAGSLAMGVAATLFPLMPTGVGAAAVLAVVNFPAAFPFGVTAAAINGVAPNRIRGRLSALFLMVTNLLGLALGPWVVALLTERLFHDDLSIRYSLAILAAVGHGLALACMLAARRPYRAALAEARA